MSQESTLRLALFGILKGVLLPRFNPTLVRHEHVKWSKRNIRHLVYRHWSERIVSAGRLSKIGVDVGTYSFVASYATQRNTTYAATPVELGMIALRGRLMACRPSHDSQAQDAGVIVGCLHQR